MHALFSRIEAFTWTVSGADILPGLNDRVEIELVTVLYTRDSLQAGRTDLLKLLLHAWLEVFDGLFKFVCVFVLIYKLFFKDSTPVCEITSFEIVPLIVSVATSR